MPALAAPHINTIWNLGCFQPFHTSNGVNHLAWSNGKKVSPPFKHFLLLGSSLTENAWKEVQSTLYITSPLLSPFPAGVNKSPDHSLTEKGLFHSSPADLAAQTASWEMLEHGALLLLAPDGDQEEKAGDPKLMVMPSCDKRIWLNWGNGQKL